MKKFIIDTDTATDDAVALIMAINNPNIQIEAITVVAGNVSLDKCVQNALYTLSLCGSDLTVYPGMSKPLVRKLETADYVHGNDGLGDIGLKLSGFTPSNKHAVTTIIEKISDKPGEITLVCLGPLTNIASAVQLDPSIANKVKDCIIMGGVGQGSGNVTPVSEYNFWVDPEAAKIVFESGMPIKMVGWDISRKYAVIDDEAVSKISAIGTPLAKFSIDIQKVSFEFTQSLSQSDSLPDPIAMAVAIDESVITDSKKAFVSILLNDDYSRGQTAIDYIGATANKPNAEIVLAADTEKFMKMLFLSLKQ